ncbi:polycystin-2-like [Ctenocephalides felis]|uniref:polycystin-2-like n=1 Tax=Ctenocephalides felis TaxID=7515 RepID=UPI000E6E138F|nr:polycystin-2-like [Ctenocephalides felis]
MKIRNSPNNKLIAIGGVTKADAEYAIMGCKKWKRYLESSFPESLYRTNALEILDLHQDKTTEFSEEVRFMIEDYYRTSPGNNGAVLKEFFLLGRVRMRQLRVRNNSCQVHDDFRRQFAECYGFFDSENEFNQNFGPGNSSAWWYTTSSNLKGAVYWGHISGGSLYTGGGYFVDLPQDQEEKYKEIILDLKENKWIGRGTRVVFIDFTTYNPNVNLFCIAKIVFEFPPTGGILPSAHFQSVRLIPYITKSDYVILFWQFVFVIFIIYYTAAEIYELALNGFREYFRELWNYMEWTIIMCVKDIAGFAVMFFIVFFAFAQLGYLLFGTQAQGYRTFGAAVVTLLTTILGEFDYHEIEQANRVLGPIYFLSYIFFVFFVLLNMFLAIVTDTYSEVKREIESSGKGEDVHTFIKRRGARIYNRLFMKDKKDKNEKNDLTQTRRENNEPNSSPNTPKQRQADVYAQIRKTLELCNFNDLEIEMFFAKYDINGERRIDENEKQKILDYLQGRNQENRQSGVTRKTRYAAERARWT